jgi:MOSC domain-containing protein YiiM
MEVKSVNVARPRPVVIEGRAERSGIFKEPARGRVRIGLLGPEGDGWETPRGKGDDIHAVFALGHQHYGYWQTELGRDEAYPLGQFGENLTVAGLDEDQVRVGDVFRVGTTVLQATSPRIPCYKLAHRMGEGQDFPLRYLRSGRTGVYFRVLEEGGVGAGDAFELMERDQGSATIAEMVRVTQLETRDREGLQRLLASRDLAPWWRQHAERLIAKADDPVAPWEGFRTLMVDRKTPESETVTSFYLVAEDGGALPPYKPGQFLTLELDVPGQDRPVIRTYTLSDAPKPDHYRLSIKREPAAAPDLPPGVASNFFHDRVHEGTRLRAKKPIG